MLVNVLSGKKIIFKNRQWTFHFELNKESEEHIIEIKKLNETFLELKDVFDSLNVPIKSEFEDESGSVNELIEHISFFVNMLLKNDYTNLKIPEPESAKFTSLSIGKIKLIFFYNPNENNKLANAFSREMLTNDTHIEYKGNKYPHSPYVMLNKAVLATGANVNLNIIKDSFNQFDPFSNELIEEFTNNFCLMCINAFDLSKNEDLLELADEIYNLNSITDGSKVIILINRLQIKLRKSLKLSTQEIQKLIKIKQTSPENMEIQFCASVLLSSKQEAQIYFHSMDESTRKYYETLPIYSLYKQLL